MIKGLSSSFLLLFCVCEAIGPSFCYMLLLVLSCLFRGVNRLFTLNNFPPIYSYL